VFIIFGVNFWIGFIFNFGFFYKFRIVYGTVTLSYLVVALIMCFHLLIPVCAIIHMMELSIIVDGFVSFH